VSGVEVEMVKDKEGCRVRGIGFLVVEEEGV
jgi:hypothetical protein